jgi:two-component system nitrate/nitrite response regulator NarL
LPAGDAPTLTPRERSVLERVASGLSNRAIADELGLSEHTVKFHVRSLLDKLGAETRADAVARAARRGVLTL